MIRHGDYRDVLADVESVDTVIVDAPYSAKTHEGALGASDGRTEIGYAHWTAADVEEFVASWASRVKCWIVSITDDTLAPHWRASYERHGLYAFATVGIVITGMGVRMQGDGPSSWTLNGVVARRRARRLSTAPDAKGIWRTLPGGYFGPAGKDMAGGRGKPEWLTEALVRDYSDPGMTVCDPCAGWGSTLLAARKLGRHVIGCELDREAFEIAERTLNGEEARPRDEQPSLLSWSGQ